jgi:putative flippase GtrA
MIREPVTQPKMKAFITNRKEQKRFVKFAIVGAIGATVDLAVFNFLLLAVGLPPTIASPIGVFTAICSNFTWNRFWSFPESRQRPLVPQFARYLAINLVGLVINQLIFTTVLHYVTPMFGIGFPLDANLSKAFAIGVVLFWNFVVNRLTTYRGL